MSAINGGGWRYVGRQQGKKDRAATPQAGPRVETGPSLAAVLRAARLKTTSKTTVVASALDGYFAAATPGETTSGGRPLLLSLVEDGAALTRPRLVVDGDVFGGRYVSDVTVLTVTGAHRR